MGIGQGPITVTPLQQAHFAAEIAESGKIVATPRMVAGFREPGSDRVTRRDPVMMKPVDLGTDEQWEVVHDGMLAAIYGPGGTAYAVGVNSKYKIAGKTGTAQVVTVKQTESTKHQNADERKRDHAWFLAYAPADDPKIAVAVLVENGGFGGANAGPIGRKVMDAYLVPDEPPADKAKPPPAPPRPTQPKPLQANNAG